MVSTSDRCFHDDVKEEIHPGLYKRIVLGPFELVWSRQYAYWGRNNVLDREEVCMHLCRESSRDKIEASFPWYDNIIKALNSEAQAEKKDL